MVLLAAFVLTMASGAQAEVVTALKPNPQFEQAGDFNDGLAVIMMNNRFGYINKDGKLVINPQFDSAGDFANGVAPVWLGDRQGYIDRDGKYVWNPTT